MVLVSSVQSLTRVRLFVTPWTAVCQASLSITTSLSLLKFMSVELVMRFHTLLSPPPPTFNLSQHQGLFKWVSSLHQVTKALEFQLQHQSFQWIFRTGWISMLSKGLSRVFSSTTVQKHQFFGTQLSLWASSGHPYMTTGKTIALTRQTFVGKVISLLFNMLSRLVITFLTMSKCLLISWLQSPTAVILEPKK